MSLHAPSVISQIMPNHFSKFCRNMESDFFYEICLWLVTMPNTVLLNANITFDIILIYIY